MKILSNIDLSKNEAKNLKLENLASAPPSPVPGQIYFNTANTTYYGWTGTAWVPLQLKGPVTWNQLAGL